MDALGEAEPLLHEISELLLRFFQSRMISIHFAVCQVYKAIQPLIFHKQETNQLYSISR